MADSETPREDGQFDACPEACASSGCSKKCCKDNTPTHQAYGIHACSDHK